MLFDFLLYTANCFLPSSRLYILIFFVKSFFIGSVLYFNFAVMLGCCYSYLRLVHPVPLSVCTSSILNGKNFIPFLTKP